MFERTFEKATLVPASAADVFAWHQRPGAFDRLQPPWDPTKLIASEGIRDGSRVVLQVRAPWPRRWVAEHFEIIEGRQFRDRQLHGPFPSWVHTHRFDRHGPHQSRRCVMRDRIDFKLPAGPLGVIAYKLFMRRQIERMFDHRHAVVVADLIDHQIFSADKTLSVAITGASGTIGTALTHFLSTGGHAVRPVRRLDGLSFDLEAIRGADVLVHLAGEPIIQRWDQEVKDRIRRSRVDRTKVLCEQMTRLPESDRPKVMLSGSAIGVYGSREDHLLTEDSSPGDNFLAEVALDWEKATADASSIGIRVVHLRTGLVLTPRSGVLGKALLPFKFGVGGRLGSGRQYMSWISLDDHIRAMTFLMFAPNFEGPVNLVAPDPVSNLEFSKTLGRVLRRPAIVPAPRAALQIAFGDLADEALLASQRVEPMRLQQAGFRFRHPQLERTLRELLGRP